MNPVQIFGGLVLGDILHTASPLLAPSGMDSIGVVNAPWGLRDTLYKKVVAFLFFPPLPSLSKCLFNSTADYFGHKYVRISSF